jgi:hypothetical protein
MKKQNLGKDFLTRIGIVPLIVPRGKGPLPEED